MADADDLWTAVKADYDTAGLISLTNPRDRGATAVDDTAGTAAAQAVINLWPAHAQADYDASDALDVEVAELGVIAMLWRRGGASSTIEQVKWDTVFGTDGLIVRVKRTNARARITPTRGTSDSSDVRNGRTLLPWSHPDSLPPRFMPDRVSE